MTKPQTPNYRLKGPAFEHMCVAQFQHAMPGAKVHKGRQAKEGGAAQADVVMPVLHVECKWRIRQNPRDALAQACADADREQLPIAIILDDPDEGQQPEPFVVMRFSDLLTLMHSLWGLMGPVRGARWRASDWRPPPLDFEALGQDLRRRQGVVSKSGEGDGAGGCAGGDDTGA